MQKKHKFLGSFAAIIRGKFAWIFVRIIMNRINCKQLKFFVHGPPGSGKTFLANRIKEFCEYLNFKTFLTAYTGAAATLRCGCTINYLLKLNQTPIWKFANYGWIWLDLDPMGLIFKNTLNAEM